MIGQMADDATIRTHIMLRECMEAFPHGGMWHMMCMPVKHEKYDMEDMR